MNQAQDQVLGPIRTSQALITKVVQVLALVPTRAVALDQAVILAPNLAAVAEAIQTLTVERKRRKARRTRTRKAK